MTAPRVQPDGTFGSLPHRGAFMGNRGVLHRDDGVIFKTHTPSYRAWITCTLHEKPGRKRPLTAPGRYTVLFFADEAVACAAGHRPCAECRHKVHSDWKSAWVRAFGAYPGAKGMDLILAEARLGPRPMVDTSDLPSGAFFHHQDHDWLVRDGQALPHRDGVYGPGQALPQGKVTLLTPLPTVRVMQQGWRPAFTAAEDRPGW